MPDIKVRGTSQEQQIFTEASRHYDMAQADLDSRRSDWNRKDELFRSHINDQAGNRWPYSAKVFDPRIFTAIYEKSARLLANKLQGRLEPREGGDVLKSKINNEILNFQWDDAERVDGEPMLSKWARMDMNCRKYGASFALSTWHWEERIAQIPEQTRITWFDGPTFIPWNNRDVLHNPSYSTVKNWIQLRDYITLDELMNVNETARRKPVYKNLDILRDVLQKETTGGGDSRRWQSRNLSIKGLTDYLGRDPYFKVFERIRELRDDRWIEFAPRHGIIIRDIPNPFKHGRIPVVQLKYYPIDEDIYGLSEIEPIEKLQKALNALICQYLDAINMALYKPIKVRSTAVQMHTLEFGPGKKWIMNDPATDVLPYEVSNAGIAEFAQTYRFLVGAMQEALGESSQGLSTMVPGEPEKTATEIRDVAMSRNVRDNFNQMFLSEAIKDQMMFWFQMDQQFLFSGKKDKARIFRIVGKDAIDFFAQQGLADRDITDGTLLSMGEPEMLEKMADPDFDINLLSTPTHEVETKKGFVPKLEIDETGESANLAVESDDLSGTYDYIPNVKSMGTPDPPQVQALTQLMILAKDPSAVQIRAMEGKRLKLSELEKDLFITLGLKDTNKYYENIQTGGEPGTINEGGGELPNPNETSGKLARIGGVDQNSQAAFGGQNSSQLGRPSAI